MRMHVAAGVLLSTLSCFSSVIAKPFWARSAVVEDKRAEVEAPRVSKRWEFWPPAPKFVIISMFPPEAEQVWLRSFTIFAWMSF